MSQVQVTIKRGGSLFDGPVRASATATEDEDEDTDNVQYKINSVLKFGPNKKWGHMILLCGRGKSGKTTLVKHLFRCNRITVGRSRDGEVKRVPTFDEVLVLCNSPAIDSYTFVCKSNRMQYNHQIVEKLFKQQQELLEQGVKRRVLLIFDDIIGAANFHSGPGKRVMDSLSTRGRHYGILTIVLTQHYKGIPPSVRGNAWYTFLCNPTDGDVKEFYSQYGSHDTLEECKQWLKQCARNYTFAYVSSDDQEPKLFKVPEQYA